MLCFCIHLLRFTIVKLLVLCRCRTKALVIDEVVKGVVVREDAEEDAESVKRTVMQLDQRPYSKLNFSSQFTRAAIEMTFFGRNVV